MRMPGRAVRAGGNRDGLRGRPARAGGPRVAARGAAGALVGHHGRVRGPSVRGRGPGVRGRGPGVRACGPGRRVSGPVVRRTGPRVLAHGLAARIVGPTVREGRPVEHGPGPPVRSAGSPTRSVGSPVRGAGPAGHFGGTRGHYDGSHFGRRRTAGDYRSPSLGRAAVPPPSQRTDRISKGHREITLGNACDHRVRHGDRPRRIALPRVVQRLSRRGYRIRTPLATAARFEKVAPPGLGWPRMNVASPYLNPVQRGSCQDVFSHFATVGIPDSRPIGPDAQWPVGVRTGASEHHEAGCPETASNRLPISAPCAAHRP
jgi:hypothetical protein